MYQVNFRIIDIQKIFIITLHSINLFQLQRSLTKDNTQ